MNPLIKKYYDQQIKVNKDIVDGWATKELRGAPEFIDRVLKGSMQSANPRFKYLGIEELSDIEEYYTKIGKIVDVNITDTTMYKLNFEFDGQPLGNTYTALPFVRQAGIFHKSGTKYSIVPVLTDDIITPGRNNVFVKLLGIKQFFYSIKRNLIKNNKDIFTTIIYSNSLSTSVDLEETKTIGKIIAPAIYFVLSKYGLRETFKKFCGVKNDKDVLLLKEKDDLSKYTSKYNIYRSIKRLPKEVREKYDIDHDILILVNKKYDSELIDNLISGIFYGFDIFSYQAKLIFDDFNNNDLKYEIKNWIILTGKLAYRDRYSVQKSYELITDRHNQIKSYLDIISKERLENTGIMLESFYELITYLIVEYDNFVLRHNELRNNNFNRHIEVNYYILFNFIYGINRMIHDINNACEKKNPNINNITKIINSKLNTKTIFGITKGGKTNIALAPVDSTTDSMFTKITGLMELQERAVGVYRDPNSSFPYNVRSIDASDFYIGTILNLKKNAPTAKLAVNPFAEFDHMTGKSIVHKEHRVILDVLDMMLSGKMMDDTISDNMIETEDVKL